MREDEQGCTGMHDGAWGCKWRAHLVHNSARRWMREVAQGCTRMQREAWGCTRVHLDGWTHEVAQGCTGITRMLRVARGCTRVQWIQWAQMHADTEVAQPCAHGCTRSHALHQGARGCVMWHNMAQGGTRLHGVARGCTGRHEDARGCRACTGTDAEGHPRTPAASLEMPTGSRGRTASCTGMHEDARVDARGGRLGASPRLRVFSSNNSAAVLSAREYPSPRGAGGASGEGGGAGEGGEMGREERERSGGGGIRTRDSGTPGRGLGSSGVGVQHHGQRQWGSNGGCGGSIGVCGGLWGLWGSIGVCGVL